MVPENMNETLITECKEDSSRESWGMISISTEISNPVVNLSIGYPHLPGHIDFEVRTASNNSSLKAASCYCNSWHKIKFKTKRTWSVALAIFVLRYIVHITNWINVLLSSFFLSSTVFRTTQFSLLVRLYDLHPSLFDKLLELIQSLTTNLKMNEI